MTHENPVILALYPNAVGVGFACLQIPDKLFDFGVTTVNPICNDKLLKKAERFMNYYRPKIVLLKEPAGLKISRRTDKLIENIAKLSDEKGLMVYRYTNKQIKEVFEIFGATSKYEVSQILIKMFPETAHRAPKAKKWYEKEDYNMIIFHALSLAVTHQYLTE